MNSRNYRDQESDRKYAENHFGLIDFRGYPKPVYMAYVHLYSLLKTRQFVERRKIDKNILVNLFEDQTGKVLVIWNRSFGKRKIPVEKFDFDPERASITNAVGKPESMTNGMIEVGEAPLFIFVSK